MQIVLQTINDWATAIQVVSTAALVVITFFYMLLTRSLAVASQESINEMRLTREAQSRAYVTLELWPWDRQFDFFDLAIRNYGAGAARDIHFDFDKQIPSPEYPGRNLNNLGVLDNLAFIAPHDVVLIFLGRQKRIREAKDVPDIWEGTVRFTDDVGLHENRFRIDLREFDQLELPFPAGEEPAWAPPIRYGWGRTGAREKIPPTTWG